MNDIQPQSKTQRRKEFRRKTVDISQRVHKHIHETLGVKIAFIPEYDGGISYKWSTYSTRGFHIDKLSDQISKEIETVFGDELSLHMNSKP